MPSGYCLSSHHRPGSWESQIRWKAFGAQPAVRCLLLGRDVDPIHPNYHERCLIVRRHDTRRLEMQAWISPLPAGSVRL